MTEDELTAALMSDRVRGGIGWTAFEGIVVAVFQKHEGAWRCVVEADNGDVRIFSAQNLERVRAMEQSK